MSESEPPYPSTEAAANEAGLGPFPIKAEQDNDGSRWMKRFLNGEYERWLVAKQLLNVREDHVIVKVLLDFFQAHGGFDVAWQEPPADLAPEPRPLEPSRPVKDETRDDRPDLSGAAAGQPTVPPRRACPAGATPSDSSDSPSQLPSLDPVLIQFFSCGLCGATGFADLAAHFAHLWSEHTELRMLGSAQRRRVPLKLRPHMFVTCALCGLNNRSTSTPGVADRHLTVAHMPARHRHLQQTAAGPPQQFACDECPLRAASRAELVLHALDAGHECGAFTCRACGVEGDGRANARHHRRWHRARRPFLCYLCAEPFAAEPDCVAHVRAEHQRQFNVHRCARCAYATSTVAQFVQHARTHVGLNACVCHLCGVVFQTGQSLRRHLLTHARAEFRCQHCDKTFRHPLPLERHVKSRHVSPDDHTCAACGKLFSTRYHRDRHAMIHSGRRPHRCGGCGRAFVQKGDLVRHVKKCGDRRPPVASAAKLVPMEPGRPVP